LILIMLGLVWASGDSPSGAAPSLANASSTALSKIDALAERRLARVGYSRVVLRAVDSVSASSMVPVVMNAGGMVRRTLPVINALVADVPNSALLTLAANPLVARLSVDRRAIGSLERTAATIGAASIRQALGYDGAGVGVAVIDSGVTPWHDDLAANQGGQRVEHFVDFINGWESSYDDYGHGSHVAGIIAGNGFDSSGARTGVAPGARLIVLKVLNGSGGGYISDVIAALDYVVEHRTALNIRVVNVSVAAGVHESYNTDPLTVAAKRVVEAGIVVVTAAGNGGRNPDGRPAYGGVTAPANAPWVLTVAASSHMGTAGRADDVMADFSSRGPSRFDQGAKPDIVAPGVGIESLSNPDSALYTTKADYLLPGSVPTSYLPYLSLSGTSMAAPVVSGTVALMLQANPSLTPNLVKAILQFTAEVKTDRDPLTQGAGFLNAAGAVALARYFAQPGASDYPSTAGWGRRMIWGNRLVWGGWLTPGANAWAMNVGWGGSTTPGGEIVKWGVTCAGLNCGNGTGNVWSPSTGHSLNVVWGSVCDGADCQWPWTVDAVDDDESVVWGTTDPDESVVWGTTDEDESVVWGTGCGDPACEPVIWPR
jgi:serine protease AprX